MRIAHIPRRFTQHAWGGTEAVVTAMVQQQLQQGHEVAVYTSKALDHVAHEDVAGVPVHRFDYGYGEWPLSSRRRQRYDLKGGNLASYRLAQALECKSKFPDIIHCHTGNRLGGQMRHLAHSMKVPCVLTLHGGHFAIPADEQGHLRADDCGPRGIPWGKYISWRYQTRDLLRLVDGIICVGIEEYELAQKKIPEQKIFFLPGGVDVRRFAAGNENRGRALIGARGGVPLIVSCARIDEQKDPETIVRAWRQLRLPVDLALVGPETTPGIAARCRELASGGPGHLYLPGGVTAESIPDVMAAASVAVLASRHEPFGLACLEAWAASVPLIATNIGGPAWLLNRGQYGSLFNPGDSVTLRDHLHQVLMRTSQVGRQVDAAYDRVCSEFTWQHRARKLQNIYDGLIEEGMQ